MDACAILHTIHNLETSPSEWRKRRGIKGFHFGEHDSSVDLLNLDELISVAGSEDSLWLYRSHR